MRRRVTLEIPKQSEFSLGMPKRRYSYRYQISEQNQLEYVKIKSQKSQIIQRKSSFKKDCYNKQWQQINNLQISKSSSQIYLQSLFNLDAKNRFVDCFFNQTNQSKVKKSFSDSNVRKQQQLNINLQNQNKQNTKKSRFLKNNQQSSLKSQIKITQCGFPILNKKKKYLKIQRQQMLSRSKFCLNNIKNSNLNHLDIENDKIQKNHLGKLAKSNNQQCILQIKKLQSQNKFISTQNLFVSNEKQIRRKQVENIKKGELNIKSENKGIKIVTKKQNITKIQINKFKLKNVTQYEAKRVWEHRVIKLKQKQNQFFHNLLSYTKDIQNLNPSQKNHFSQKDERNKMKDQLNYIQNIKPKYGTTKKSMSSHIFQTKMLGNIIKTKIY